MQPARLARVSELIKEEVSKLLVPLLAENWGIVSVTQVIVSRDLSTAKIYLSFLPKAPREKELAQIIGEHLDDVKFRIKKLKLKKMPRLHFYASRNLETFDKIDALLKKYEN